MKNKFVIFILINLILSIFCIKIFAENNSDSSNSSPKQSRNSLAAKDPKKAEKQHRTFGELLGLLLVMNSNQRQNP